MKTLGLLALLLASMTGSGAPMACPVLSEPEQIARQVADRAELEELVPEAAGAADLVFVGRALSVGSSAEKEGIVRHPTKFDVISMVKGFASQVANLYWEETPMTVNVGCSGANFFSHVDITETYRYLVYVEGQKIVRARPMVDWEPMLSAEEELHILQSRK